MSAADKPQPLARVGLISDTHGKVDPRVHDALAGVDAIIHAGDICKYSVLFELQTISPNITAVLGNCDFEEYGWGLRLQARVDICGVCFLVIHDIHDLGPIPDGIDVVVCGHSHQPSVQYHGRVLVVNPGSASQRRRMPSRSVAIAEIFEDSHVDVHTVQLDHIGPPPQG